MADGRRVCRIGCRSELDLRNLESSALENWAIVRNLVLGSGTLVAADFGQTELVNEFHLSLGAPAQVGEDEDTVF